MQKTFLAIAFFLIYVLSAQSQVLYGTTNNGGSVNAGVICSYDHSLSIYTKVKELDNTTGSNPSGGLVRGSDGKLYGMTTNGGVNTYGTIYSYDLSSHVYTTLMDFDNTNGAYPYGSLTLAPDGNFYGLTSNGGGGMADGVMFSFNPTTLIYTKLKVFINVSDDYNAVNPLGSLLLATDGKLYGMASEGGLPSANFEFGNIFSYDIPSATYTSLFQFSPSDGAYPYGSLIQASNGILYGMASYGGGPSEERGQLTGFGVIFSFNPSTATYTKLYEFDSTNGANPNGSLIQARNGKLYGMTYAGGNNGGGVIFSYDLSTSTYTKVKAFDQTDGANPYGNLFQAGDGKLYGMTSAGGSSNHGVIFSLEPTAATYTKLIDFDSTNGAFPYYGSGFIEPANGALPVTLINFIGKNIGSNNELSWKVENELNLNYYELQRSVDGQNFSAITQVKAAGNNNYSYNDPIAFSTSSLFYYRLKSFDKDGKFKFSDVIKIRTNQNGFVVVNPNPFRNKLVIQIESPARDKAGFILTDMSGRLLFKENKLLLSGTNTIEISETERLSKGTYLLTIIESNHTESIKVVKGN